MFRFLLCAALLAAPLEAAHIRDCDNLDANASNVDWQEPTRTYANGAIRLIKIDIDEPDCCAGFLMVLYPQTGEVFPRCNIIERERGFGWSDLRLNHASASYDPAIGLTVVLPVHVFENQTLTLDSLRVTINQAHGRLSAR